MSRTPPGSTAPAPASGTLFGLPWQAVAVAAVAVVGLLVLSPPYGWHRDELYFVVAGRHPAFGYVDQPALTPLLSAGAVALLGAFPTAVRILPGPRHRRPRPARGAVGSRPRRQPARPGAGGARRGGLGAPGGGSPRLDGHVRPPGLGARAVAGRPAPCRGDPRLWLAVGLVAGIALENKHIILFLGAGLAGGMLLARRWDVVRSPWAWAASGSRSCSGCRTSPGRRPTGSRSSRWRPRSPRTRRTSAR